MSTKTRLTPRPRGRALVRASLAMALTIPACDDDDGETTSDGSTTEVAPMADPSDGTTTNVAPMPDPSDSATTAIPPMPNPTQGSSDSSGSSGSGSSGSGSTGGSSDSGTTETAPMPPPTSG